MQACGRGLIVLVAVLLLVGCQDRYSGGFQDRDTIEGVSLLRGRAVSDTGEPQPGVSVYLSEPQGGMLRSRTDEGGEFVFEQAPAGPGVLVLNNGRGEGALLDVTVYSSGENGLGDIAMGPLVETPQIVDVHGVGFEERVTRMNGSLLSATFNKDASRAYVFRRSPSGTELLVEVDTRNNAERVLAESEDGELSWVTLLEDRALIYDRFVQGGRSKRRYIYDVAGEREIYSTDRRVHAGGMQLVDDSVCLIEALEEGWRPVCVRLGSGQVRRGEGLGDRDPQMWASDAQLGLIVMARSICASGLDECSTLTVLDPESLSPRSSLELSAQAWFSLLPGGGLIGALGEQDGVVELVKMNPVTGGVASLTRLECGHDCFVHGIYEFSANGREALFRLSDRRARLDLETGAVVFLPDVLTVNGAEVELCLMGDSQYLGCSAGYRGDVVEVVARLSAEDSARVLNRSGHVWLILEWPDGLESEPHVEIFSHPNQEYVGLSGFQESPDGRTEVTIVHDLETSFGQIVQRMDSGELVQRTFLNSGRWQLKFSAEGDALYYITRDPISGESQVFRLDLDSLPEP